jgi:N terminus of Rad21 / Rec8 like protein
MLGVVRIYYKQVEYLEHDAQGALVKLRQVGLSVQNFCPPYPQHSPQSAGPTSSTPCTVWLAGPE